MEQNFIAMEQGKYGDYNDYFSGIIMWGDTEAQVKNAEFILMETKFNKKIILWKSGIWEDGIWGDGVWKEGVWENGTWKTGIMYDVNHIKGEFETGLFYNKELRKLEKKSDENSSSQDKCFFLDDYMIPQF